MRARLSLLLVVLAVSGCAGKPWTGPGEYLVNMRGTGPAIGVDRLGRVEDLDDSLPPNIRVEARPPYRAARRVRRVILADGNFCHPRVASWLDAVPTVGWEEVLKHSAQLPDAVIRATDDNLDILALGSNATRDPQSLAAGLQAAVSAGVLRHAYDMVLVDLGTFFDPASQPVVLELVRNMGIDTVVAVAGPEPADPRDMATITEYLEPLGCQLMGTIENRVAKSLAV